MSWFSDFAKSAFNEAQKRIDKALDIEEESNSKPNGNIGNLKVPSIVEDVPVIDVSSTLLDKQATSLASQRRSSLSNSSAKKRAKPMKLGSSLSKKQSSPEPKLKNINYSDKLSSTQTNQSGRFQEISLATDNVSSNHNQDDEKELIKDESDSNSQQVVGSLETSLHSVEKNDHSSPRDQGLVDLSAGLSDTCLSVDENCIANEELSSTGHQPHVESQSNADIPHSPCDSTTTSSEIDILDHESTMSETSTASKLHEFENHLKPVGVESNDHIRMSCSDDHADSETSDIVRIGGYCSSLSVSSCDGVPMNLPRTRSPVSFGNHNSTPLPPSPTLVVVADEDCSKVTTYNNASEDNLGEKNSFVNIALSDEEDPILSHSSTAPTESLSNHSSLYIAEKSSSSTVENMSLDGVDSTTNSFNVSLNSENMEANHTRTDNTLLEEKSDIDQDVIEDNSDNVPASIPGQIIKEIENEPSDERGNPELPDKNASPSERFEAYEQQLVALSLSNATLREENDNLRSELSNAELEREQKFEEEQVNLLQTVDNLSEKVQALELQKSAISHQLAQVQAELSQRLSNDQVQRLIAEKEESIQGLLEEGETLSKKHLQQSNSIKKLRAKLSERDVQNKEQSEKLVKLEEENKSLKLKLTEIKGQSSEDRGAAERLSEAYQEREAELSDMRSKLEDAEEKRRAAQSTLDAAYKDLAELNKKQAALKSEREIEMREHEASVMKRMQQEIEKIQQDHGHQMHMKMLQLGEMQDSFERAEAIHSRKEDQLRKEVKDLQQRFQDSELRNQELSESITESTRPILRQMENLQSTYSTQAKTWETLEKSLTARLGDAQGQLVASQDQERSLQLQMVDLKSKIGSLEKQLVEARSQKNSLSAELEQLRSTASQHDDEVAGLKSQLGATGTQLEETKAKARRDRLTLENQLDMEKVRAEVDRKKFLSQLEAVQKEKERLLWISRQDSVASSANALNLDTESLGSSSDTFNNLDVFERQLSTSGTPNGVYDSLRSGATGSSLLEYLQSQLKMRDGEISQLQGEINTLERTRSSMAEEIVRLTNENEDLQAIAKDVESLKTDLKEMEARHDAVLTMYGEKAEEAEELKLDLEDVKSMYRQQIECLLKTK